MATTFRFNNHHVRVGKAVGKLPFERVVYEKIIRRDQLYVNMNTASKQLNSEYG